MKSPAFKSPSPKKKKISFSDDVDSERTFGDQSMTSPSPNKSNLSISRVINTAEHEFMAEDEIKEETASDNDDPNFMTLQSPKRSGPQPMTIIHTPVESAQKRRQKHASESAESTNGRLDSDAGNSSQSESSAKKKSKKDKAKKVVEAPTLKPPRTVQIYFKTHIFTGKPKKAQKAFDKLSKKERKLLQVEYNEKVESYVKHLKLYLASLPKEEAEAYVSRIDSIWFHFGFGLCIFDKFYYFYNRLRKLKRKTMLQMTNVPTQVQERAKRITVVPKSRDNLLKFNIEAIRTNLPTNKSC